jgi:hypothetical protein
MRENTLAKRMLEGKFCDYCIHRDDAFGHPLVNGQTLWDLCALHPIVTVFPEERTCKYWEQGPMRSVK